MLSLQDKLDEDERTTILDAVNEALEWVEENPEAEADDIKEKLKEVEDICQPIVAKVYQGAGGGGGEGGDDEEDLGDHDEL